ncbi:cystathionine gamma-synthase 1, chloroplastic-like [Panicum miliaceum]|uniref:Cystathionine gamma-synthase 1, chloroplastic-like n=1 Tax=Panicum miliaceum TaxID=4540 RepID=A0A3L6TV25_PANMI|nr:cystathionine gamma-synthase 1, chloroplastic-like [Panicum miliaceum]
MSCLATGESAFKIPGARSTFINLDDMETLKAILEENDVSLFYADSPTNPLLKCVDIRLIAELCHRRGALVYIDSMCITHQPEAAHLRR